MEERIIDVTTTENNKDNQENNQQTKVVEMPKKKGRLGKILIAGFSMLLGGAAAYEVHENRKYKKELEEYKDRVRALEEEKNEEPDEEFEEDFEEEEETTSEEE